jgi:hypothetical protein
MAVTRRAYAGGPAQTVLQSAIDSTDTTVLIAASTGWPSGAPFFVAVDAGQVFEEKMLVTRSGIVLTVSSRGVDGTSAADHNAGAIIYPCLSATDLDEANFLASRLTAKGDLFVYDGSDVVRLPVGSDGQVLSADSTEPSGLKWITP